MPERPIALVYRGESTEQDDDLAEPLAAMIKASPYNFEVKIVGPNEDEDVDEDTLEDADLFAYPGGPDLDTAWNEIKQSRKDLKAWVSDGGKYLGICLGAYLAGESPGLGFLPKGADTDSECEQKNAQVDNDEDAIIQVDWTYAHGPRAGQTHKDQWAYFQEGPCFKNFHESDDAFILAKFSKSGRVAATLNAHGDGWVGLCSIHPEADQSWFDEYELPTPQGIRYDLGLDVIAALMEGGVSPRTGTFEAAPGGGQYQPQANNGGRGGLMERLMDKAREYIDN